MVRDLAQFRYNLRRFLRFSEKAARDCGVTPQQHQLMLGIAGFTGRGTATISELAEFLQEKHNSVVGLVERAELRGLIRRERDAGDRRLAIISLTAEGKEILSRLSELHETELKHAEARSPAEPCERPIAEIAEKGRSWPAFSLTFARP